MHLISVDYQTLLIPHPAMLSDDATTELVDAISQNHPWIIEILGVLPVLAFLDAVNPHHRLHICELVGTVPIWSWTVTPAAYTTLFSGDDTEEGNGEEEDDDDENGGVRPCHMDEIGETHHWMATDGRHGHQYAVSNAETLRRCLSASPRRPISNLNGKLKDRDARVHRLEIIRVSPRRDKPRRSLSSSASEVSSLKDLVSESSKVRVDLASRLVTIVTSGWIIMAGCLGAALKTECFLGAAYLCIVGLTGLCVHLLYGSQPRTLMYKEPSGVNRMVVVARHSNATSWKVFYGDSNILKSLLEQPLTSEHQSLSKSTRGTLRNILRGLILAQWAVALSAAARKDANGIVVYFWVLVSAVAFRHLATPTMGVQLWMKSHAGVVIERYQLKLSSRLSLLSTLVALNPDTPPFSPESDAETASGDVDPMGWLDTVWRESALRRRWEETLRRALTATFQATPVGNVAVSGHKDDFWQSVDWKGTWKVEKKPKPKKKKKKKVEHDEGEAEPPVLVEIPVAPEADEWLPSIYEGLNMTARVQTEAERLVTRSKPKVVDEEDLKILI